jgi:hypothetical protein
MKTQLPGECDQRLLVKDSCNATTSEPKPLSMSLKNRSLSSKRLSLRARFRTFQVVTVSDIGALHEVRETSGDRSALGASGLSSI